MLLEGGTLELEGRGDKAVIDAEFRVLQADGLHQLEAAQLCATHQQDQKLGDPPREMSRGGGARVALALAFLA